jgi:hypothetical protein
VGNAVNLLQPALAIRGSGCITCHAEVHSNVITDFGYGGDGASRNYFFGQLAPDASYSWNTDMVYGDQDALKAHGGGATGVGSWAYLNLMKNGDGSGQKVYVPVASIPAGPAAATGASTLKGYIQHRLANSFYADSPTATVIEKSTFYIGAPTISRLQAVFQWNGATDGVAGYKYIPDAGGAALSGLAKVTGGTTYFKNNGTLVCEGDLMIEGAVYLNNATISTHKGCRIYATGSVFIYGPITYSTAGAGDFTHRNLQISSTRSIIMGLGELWNGATHCENGSSDAGYWGYYTSQVANADSAGFTGQVRTDYFNALRDSAKWRLYAIGSVPDAAVAVGAYHFRAAPMSGTDYSRSIYNEMMSSIGQQKDAACRAEGRNVAYSRLLLNAPLVHSRYTGGFTGSIISEVGLMGLGLGAGGTPRFKFDFDPVFQNVDILPLLKEQDFLHVQ